MAFDNTLAIWPSFITFVQHFVDCLFFCHYSAFNLQFADLGTTPTIVFFPNPRPLTCHKTQTLHQWFSPMCQWDPRVAGLHSKEPLQWLFHWLVSMLWLNVCKPVKSTEKKKKTALLGLTACSWKLWHYKTQEWQKRFLKKDVVIVLRKTFLQMHATNNHSDIILPLKFLLMMFLSDALMVSNGAPFHTSETW